MKIRNMGIVYLTSLESEDFPDDGVICLSSQLIEIIHLLSPILNEVVWYVSDVETNGRFEWENDFSGYKLKKIGCTQDVMAMINQTDQFVWGVFLAFPPSIKISEDWKFATDHEQFRDMRGAILEIRTFDTSFLEIYSPDLILIIKISREYHSDIFVKVKKRK